MLCFGYFELKIKILVSRLQLLAKFIETGGKATYTSANQNNA